VLRNETTAALCREGVGEHFYYVHLRGVLHVVTVAGNASEHLVNLESFMLRHCDMCMIQHNKHATARGRLANDAGKKA
jgi:hypothetical protein